MAYHKQFILDTFLNPKAEEGREREVRALEEWGFRKVHKEPISVAGGYPFFGRPQQV